MSTNKPFFRNSTPPDSQHSEFSNTQPFDIPTQPAGLESLISSENFDLEAMQKASEKQAEQPPTEKK